jgi:hypothetical protein
LPARERIMRRMTSVRLCAILDGVAAHLAAAHAGGVAGADDRADRRAGDGDRLHPHLVQRLGDDDVGEAARPAAAERQCDRLHRAPASREAPGRLRQRPHHLRLGRGVLVGRGAVANAPAMPCRIAAMRKKL